MRVSDHRTDPSFTVLFVCTANLCRSPIAEHLLRTVLAQRAIDWQVESAGIIARDGRPMHKLAGKVLDERGIEYRGWTSRRLTSRMIKSADLILTAEVRHRQSVVTMVPGAVRYAFTLLQFASLLELSPTDNRLADRPAGAALIRRAVQARSQPQSRDDRRLELADPIREPMGAFRDTATRIDTAIVQMTHGLGAAAHQRGAVI